MARLYSLAIKAHPSRADFIPYLQEKLGDVPVAWSEVPGDNWPNHKRALRLCEPARFHGVISDDALIGENFHERLTAVLEEHGDQYVYSLFYRNSENTPPRMHAAALAGLKTGGFHYLKMGWGLAVVVPSREVVGIVRHGDRIPWLGFPRDIGEDRRIKLYLRKRRMETFYPLPSLVDQRPDAVSINKGHSNEGLQAWRFE